jgi:hypothetical protein
MDKKKNNIKYKKIKVNTFLLTGKINNYEIINNLKNIIKEKSKTVDINYKTNVTGFFSGFNSLNENIDFINFIKEIKKEINSIFKYNFFIKSSWGNICKKGDEVIEHSHNETSGFCGILYLTDGGPGTYFKEFDINVEEKVGKFVLFHPLLLHSVKKIDTDIERITIAFNINKFKPWDNEVLNIRWIK